MISRKHKFIFIIAFVVILIILYSIFSLNIFLFTRGYKAFDYTVYKELDYPLPSSYKNGKILKVNDKENNFTYIMISQNKIFKYWEQSCSLYYNNDNKEYLWAEPTQYYDNIKQKYIPDFCYHKLFEVSKHNFKNLPLDNLPDGIKYNLSENSTSWIIEIYSENNNLVLDFDKKFITLEKEED